MAVVQQLLVRALVARVLASSRTGVRSSSGARGLHDRFMLPHFVWQDFREVLRELCEHGFALSSRVVRAALRVSLSALRRAREGRASSSSCARRSSRGRCSAKRRSAGGQARYVDSSLERMQVRVRGMTESRHTVCCNGIELPLSPTGTRG